MPGRRSAQAPWRGHDQRATTQALGVAHRRYGDVDLLPDANGGKFVVTITAATFLSCKDCVVGKVVPELRQHVDDALRRKRRLRRLIARAVETDDQAVADQLVVADALHRRQIFDPLGADCLRTASSRQERHPIPDLPVEMRITTYSSERQGRT